MQQNQGKKLPDLKEVNKNALKKEVDKMNQLLAKLRSENISVTNDLIYAAAVVTRERLGVQINKKKYEGKPRWKRHLEGQVKRLRKGLSRVEELRRGTKIKAKFEEELQRRYWIKEKGLIAVETVCHITSQCPKLAQKEYKRRHDCVTRSLHRNLCKQNAIECCSKWYEHQPDSVIETEHK